MQRLSGIKCAVRAYVQTNMLAVMLLPGVLFCMKVVVAKMKDRLGDTNVAGVESPLPPPPLLSLTDCPRAAVPVAMATLFLSPFLWLCILRRDEVNAAQHRARVANAATAAVTGFSPASAAYRRTGNLQLRPSALVRADTEFRAASGMSSRQCRAECTPSSA